MILWDAGSPMSGAGTITPSAKYVRVQVSSIPDYFSQTADVPPRYYRLGTVGWMDGDRRGYGQVLTYADQLLQADLEDTDGIYWILPTGVSGTIYRGMEMTGEIAVGARVYNSANISLPDGAETTMTFDTESFDPFGMHSGTTNPARVIAPEPGWYQIVGQVVIAGNATGYRSLRLYLNGGTHLATQSQLSIGAGQATSLVVTATYYMAKDDYIELRAFQNSGVALDSQASSVRAPSLAMVRVG